jgi:integrase
VASILRVFLKAAVVARLIDSSPAADLRTTWGHPRRRTVLPSIKQVEKLARAMDLEWRGYGDLVRLLAYTGMRWDELSALQWTDVDLKHRRIAIAKTATVSGGPRSESDITKTSTSDRNVVILDQAVQPLERLRELAQRNRDSQFVSSGAYGGPLHYSVWRRHLAKAQAASEVVYTAHQLRHVAASILIAAGANVEIVRNQMGHSRTSVTETVYRHAFLLDNRDLARRLSQQVTDLEIVELGLLARKEVN